MQEKVSIFPHLGISIACPGCFLKLWDAALPGECTGFQLAPPQAGCQCVVWDV